MPIEKIYFNNNNNNNEDGWISKTAGWICTFNEAEKAEHINAIMWPLSLRVS